MKQYTKNGEIKTRNQIVLRVTKTIVRDGVEKEVEMNVYNPTEEMILADGWVEYIPPQVDPQPQRKSKLAVMQEIVLEQYNQRTDISDIEALDRMVVIYDWEYYVGKVLKYGQVVVYDDKVWRVRQEHTVLEVYPPSLNTASLYEVIEIIPTGEKDDPIPYTPPMEIFLDKYYTEDNILYVCTRGSGGVLTHNLKDLINLYVSIVE
jgi:hypothetical protein